VTTSVDLTDVAPDTDPVTPAVLIACALAREGNPLAGMDPDYINRTQTSAREKYSDAELLNWRDHANPGTWDYTWSWARRMTRTYFDQAEGVEELPSDHTHLPTATTAP